jgi:hypothetical protein
MTMRADTAPTLKQALVSEKQGNSSLMFATSMVGRVWPLAQDGKGCRDLQDMLEGTANKEDRCSVAAELQGHVWDALCSPNANHVLQKLIVTMPPGASQFIIDELMCEGRVGEAARHKYGCRVLQRLLEHCRIDQLRTVVDLLLQDSAALSDHPYANYVIMHLFEYGTHEQQCGLIDSLARHISSVAASIYGCAVLGKALDCADCDQQLVIVRAIIQDNGLVVNMAWGRRGQLVVKPMLQFLELSSPERASICAQILAARESLSSKRCGRSMISACLAA